jgi:two-component system nitrogen regulation response regulator NtrX
MSNVVSYLVAMTEGAEVEVSDLPPKFRDAARKADPQLAQIPSTSGKGFYEQVAAFESALLRREYARLEGNVSKIALELGMDRSHLYTKLKEYGIHAAKPGRSKADPQASDP